MVVCMDTMSKFLTKWKHIVVVHTKNKKDLSLQDVANKKLWIGGE